MFSSRNIIILLFVILYLHSIFALKCHQCNSIGNPECKDKVKTKNFTVTCSESQYPQNVLQDISLFRGNHPVSFAKNETWHCAKVVGHDAKLSVTWRSCIKNTTNFCNYVADRLNVTVDNCIVCSSDLCNSSASFSISYYSIGILVLMFTFMK